MIPRGQSIELEIDSVILFFIVRFESTMNVADLLQDSPSEDRKRSQQPSWSRSSWPQPNPYPTPYSTQDSRPIPPGTSQTAPPRIRPPPSSGTTTPIYPTPVAVSPSYHGSLPPPPIPSGSHTPQTGITSPSSTSQRRLNQPQSSSQQQPSSSSHSSPPLTSLRPLDAQIAAGGGAASVWGTYPGSSLGIAPMAERERDRDRPPLEWQERDRDRERRKSGNGQLF